MGSLPIGQEIGVTTLQLAVAFSAIANKGMMMRPYVVSAILSPDGKTLKQTAPKPVRQVIQPKTAESLTLMLQQVVASGTAPRARINGYTPAGKTGTAQKPNLSAGGYFRNKYVSLFAGFVPAHDPAACIVVVADSPRGKYYGGQVAAPAFKEVAQGVLNYLEIPPTAPEPDRQRINASLPAQKVDTISPVTTSTDGLPCMPDIRGMTMKTILHSLSIYSLSFEFEGSGIAFRQIPAPGERIEKGQKCQVAFKNANI